CFFFQAEDGIRDPLVTGVQTCALPILARNSDLCRSATSSWRLFSSSSWNRRAFSSERADWVAKVLRSSTTSAGNSPGAFRFSERSEERRVGKEGKEGGSRW